MAFFAGTRARGNRANRFVAVGLAVVMLPGASLSLIVAPASADGAVVDGVLDSSFGSGGMTTTSNADNFVLGSAIALDSSGRSVVAGTARLAGIDGIHLSRYTPAGSLDPTFGVGGVRSTHRVATMLTAREMVIDSLARIVVAGEVGTDPTGHFVARFTPEGTLDASFGNQGMVIDQANAVAQIGGLAVDSVGRIVMAGSTTATGMFLGRYTAAGLPDVAFSGDGVLTDDGLSAKGIALDSQDRVVVVGSGLLARYTAAGQADGTFDTDGRRLISAESDGATEVALTAAGIAVAGGRWQSGYRHIVVSRYNDAGVLDTAFGAAGYAEVSGSGADLHANSLRVDSLGRLVVSGTAAEDGDSGLMVLRLRSNGTPDNAFGGYGDALSLAFDDPATGYPADLSGRAAAIDQQDRIVVAGSHIAYAGATRFSCPAAGPDGPHLAHGGNRKARSHVGIRAFASHRQPRPDVLPRRDAGDRTQRSRRQPSEFPHRSLTKPCPLAGAVHTAGALAAGPGCGLSEELAVGVRPISLDVSAAPECPSGPAT